MKRRKNAVYKGQSKRASTGTGDREIVDTFYETLNDRLRPEDEVEIIPPEQINPTHDPKHQMLIVTDYCVRKILPEITSLFAWGDEVTPRLRALTPIVDQETANAAYAAVASTAYAAHAAADTVPGAPAFVVAYRAAAARAYESVYHATDAARTAYGAVVREAARCVYYALITCIEAGDEAAYDRIIDLTNEMLESL